MDKIFKRLITNIYKYQRRNSKVRCHKLPNYTKVELSEWIKKQPNFETLYNNWVQSGYKTDLIPSCDRIDNDKGYTFNNIQLTTWQVNRANSYRDMRLGKIITNNPHKAVIQYDNNMNKIDEYVSISEAARQTGFSISSISNCCKGNLLTACGYLWKYK